MPSKKAPGIEMLFILCRYYENVILKTEKAELKLNEKLKAVVLSAEKQTGIRFSNSVIYEVLRYSLYKLEYIRKEMSYLPVLFENELRDYAAREEINKKGGANYVYPVRDDTVPPRLPERPGSAQSLSLQILR